MRHFVLIFVVLAACGRTVFSIPELPCVFDRDCPPGLRCVNQICRELELPDASVVRGNKRFGEPCDAGVECESARCIPGPVGAFCTVTCDGGDCPVAYSCKSVGVSDAGVAALCAVAQPLLCQACRADTDCGASGADRCVGLDGGRFCGRDCTREGCPSLYVCEANSKQCVPAGKTCDCLPETLGLQKSCRGEVNAFGVCLGNQTCQVDGGFSSCVAPLAREETCNGVDDDCNGGIDDFTPPTCSRVFGNRTCTAPQRCLASAGLVCTAREPAAEACNLEDDDCDGKADDSFVDSAGRYVTLAHCGVCGNDCRQSIPRATATVCDVSGPTPRCLATACAAGSFLSADRTECRPIPDTLCRACQRDVDCESPGATCVTIDGAQVCTRPCGPGAAEPTCPMGYSCSANRCVPSGGSCSCSTRTQGASRSCSVDSCRGFQSCGAGLQWSTCDVSSFNPEVCDSRDNNCNGQVDEGFRNTATGRYDTATHCGFCNNDCSKYFSAPLQHTTGVCDTAPAMPRCVMGPCLGEVVGGVAFEWVDVNAQPRDGCECRRVAGNLSLDAPERFPQSGATPYVDENCDGIDGVQADAVFVSALAAAGGNGSRTAPFRSVAEGLAALRGRGRGYVLVAQGLYRENVRLFEGAQVFGGYSSDFFKRDPLVHTSTIEGVAPTALAVAAVHAESVGTGAVETIVSGFTIVGWDATAAAEGQSGASSIALLMKEVGQNLIVSNNDIFGGRGGRGGRGSTGAQGFGRQQSSALNGQRGADAQWAPNGICGPAQQRSGGSAGANQECVDGNANPGGGVVCPVYNFMGNIGQQQAYPSMLGSRNGRGGFDWSFDDLSGPGCSHVTESGFPVNIQPHDGDDGVPGAPGVSGLGGPGAGTVARHGSFVNGLWVAAPTSARAGSRGGTAQGGGGGGGGGGVARFNRPQGCTGVEVGASGGGGGAGACGGSGGQPGGAGGASFAVLVSYAALPSGLPVFRANRVARGFGGEGGPGGFGGSGGLGGSGGFGGDGVRWHSALGGKGGEGGNGGPGGGGGGGVGGPSFAYVGLNFNATDLVPGNTLLTSAGASTGGPGGAGGSSPGAMSASGGPGVVGASGNALTLNTCSVGCGPGTTCDANGVCVPN
jgi:hypothetical protein